MVLFGPTFGVEMKRAARREHLYVLRALYPVALLLWFGCNCFFDRQYHRMTTVTDMREFVDRCFHSFVIIQMLAVGLLAPPLYAPVVAEERERRTIDYLLSSRLTSCNIILSKLAVRLSYVIVTMLTWLGFLAFSGLLIGVRLDVIASALVSTAMVAVATAGVSIAISTWSRTTSDAIGKSVACLILLAIGLPTIVTVMAIWRSARSTVWYQIAEKFAYLSPRGLVSFPSDVNSPVDWTGLLISWSVYAAIGAAGIIFSIVTLRRACQPEDREASSKRRSERRKMATRRGPLADRPMLWKETMTGRWDKPIWALVVAVFAVTVGYLLMKRGEAGFEPLRFILRTSICTTLLLSVGLCVLVARADALISAEKGRNCWAALLSSAMDEREIVWGKAWGALHSIRHLIGLVLALWLAAASAAPEALLGMCAQLVTFTPLVFFATGFGLSNALRSTPNGSLGCSVAMLLILGGAIFYCVNPFAAWDLFLMDVFWMLFISVHAEFHLFAAGMINVAFRSDLDLVRDWWSAGIGAYLIGMTGYTIAGIILMKRCVTRFDLLTGRSGVWGGSNRANDSRASQPA